MTSRLSYVRILAYHFCHCMWLQILYSYPSNRAPSLEVANMCFPHGVHPRLLQRSPSMTALNQFFCSQQYSHGDTHSFIFFSKVDAAMIL